MHFIVVDVFSNGRPLVDNLPSLLYSEPNISSKFMTSGLKIAALLNYMLIGRATYMEDLTTSPLTRMTFCVSSNEPPACILRSDVH